MRECEDLLRVVFPHWDRVLFPCPDCGVLSRRAHSRYRRLIADTAVGGQPVATGLSVRRLFCDEAGCPRVRSPSRSKASLSVTGGAPRCW